jgi:phosphomannomutase
MKTLIVLDLDGTLAGSKPSLDAEMSALLHDLLGIVKVAVISGGNWPQFEKQLLSNLPHDERLVNLSLLPTCGTKLFRYAGDWKKTYSEDFTIDEKEKIVSSLKKALGEAGFKVEKVWGEVIEDRGSQITYSALGQRPLGRKKANGTLILPSGRRSRRSLILLFPSFRFDWVGRHPLMSPNRALTKHTE